MIKLNEILKHKYGKTREIWKNKKTGKELTITFVDAPDDLAYYLKNGKEEHMSFKELNKSYKKLNENKMSLKDKMISWLTDYDRRKSKRKGYNPSALNLYFKALDRAFDYGNIEKGLMDNFNEPIISGLLNIWDLYQQNEIKKLNEDFEYHIVYFNKLNDDIFNKVSKVLYPEKINVRNYYPKIKGIDFHTREDAKKVYRILKKAGFGVDIMVNNRYL